MSDCLDCGDCGGIVNECIPPHGPKFHWCNICHDDSWQLEADGLTSIYNACGCNPGESYQFQGSTQIVASGDLNFIDSIIICGHNITDGVIWTTPTSGEPDDNFVTGIGLVRQGRCLPDTTEPVVLSLNDIPPDGVDEVVINIQSNTDDVICIDEIFIGRKFFLPEDMLPADYEYIHDGTDFKSEVKNSECGQVLSRTLKQTPVDMELTIDCLTHEWIKEYWRPFIRYSQMYGVLFQPSRNNCPGDLFKGWINDTVKGSTYGDDCLYSVTMSAQGFITQPQVVKKFG